jgi:Centromere protein H (CENP-H)
LKMAAEKLIEVCLKVPALRRELQLGDIANGPLLRQRRERDELISTTKRNEFESQRGGRQDRTELAQKKELERSIDELKRQLKLETRDTELRKALVKRIRQAAYEETVVSRAALSERDHLALEILDLYRQISETEVEEEKIRESQSRIMETIEKKKTEEQERKRIKTDSDQVIKLKQERAALRRFFFVLIMESGVDWINDNALSEIVWSSK